VKFIIISDIHGNIQALQECIKVIENIEFDAIIWCGDYITDFPKSHEVIQLIQSCSQKYKSYIIGGNREKNVIDFINGKEINIRQKSNLEYTCNCLTNKDIEWIQSLPEELEILLDNDDKIYVSHKCIYEKIDKCKYKIFGHSHKQYNFRRDDIRYINPGSVGITTDEIMGAQFSILEVTDKFEKLEEIIIKYDTTNTLELIKHTPIYNDDIKWGKLLEMELKTGIDYPQMCIKEYNRIRDEHRINEESLEVWNIAINNVLKVEV